MAQHRRGDGYTMLVVADDYRTCICNVPLASYCMACDLRCEVRERSGLIACCLSLGKSSRHVLFVFFSCEKLHWPGPERASVRRLQGVRRESLLGRRPSSWRQHARLPCRHLHSQRPKPESRLWALHRSADLRRAAKTWLDCTSGVLHC